LLISFFISCEKKELTASEIVSKSMEAHGGYANWKQIDTLSFIKKTILFSKEGLKEKETKQHQSFYIGKSLNGKLNSLGTEKTSFTLTDGVYSKSLGDSLVALNEKELLFVKDAFKSAYYVVSQPFNIKESNALLGNVKDTVLGGKKMYSVTVLYNGDTNKSDQWTYFFDAQTFLIIACKVYHSPTISYIRNTKFDLETPFVFNAERESTLLKTDRNKDYLRASYFYSDFRIVFKKK